MRKLLFIITALCFLSISLYSQDEKTKTQEDKEYLKGLHKPTEEEMSVLRLELSPSIHFYTEDGEKKEFNDVLPLLQSNSYTIEPFIDDNNEIKVVVLVSLSEEEKQAMMKMQSNMPKSEEEIGKTANSFNVNDINGVNYSLDNLKGKVIVMNFWFVECKPCVMEMPELNEIVEEFKGQDVVFLGFAINDKEAISKFLEKQEFNYNIIPDSRDLISSYGINSFPTHIIIDKESKVTFLTSGLGPTTIDDIKKKIREQF